MHFHKGKMGKVPFISVQKSDQLVPIELLLCLMLCPEDKTHFPRTFLVFRLARKYLWSQVIISKHFYQSNPYSLSANFLNNFLSLMQDCKWSWPFINLIVNMAIPTKEASIYIYIHDRDHKSVFLSFDLEIWHFRVCLLGEKNGRKVRSGRINMTFYNCLTNQGIKYSINKKYFHIF